MKRISIVAALSLALLVYAHPQTPLSKSQTPATKAQRGSSSPSIRLVKVNAQTIGGLPADKNYLAELSPGVVYEFNPAADFKRVMLRTGAREEALGPWLEKTFSKQALTRLNSKGLHIGAAADIRQLPPSQKPPRTTSPVLSCGLQGGVNFCSCETIEECQFMLWYYGCGFTMCLRDRSWCSCAVGEPA